MRKKKTPTLLGVFDKLEVKHWQYQMTVPPVWVNPSSFRMLAVDCPDQMQLEAIDRPYEQLLQWGTDLEIISVNNFQ